MTLLEWLRQMTELIPPGGAVFLPRDWVRTELDRGDTKSCEAKAAEEKRVFTPAEVARRYNRSTSTVRGWCEQGLLPGAFQLRGKAWRIPASALAIFEAQAPETLRAAPDVTARSLRHGQSISDWREHVQKRGK